MKIDVFFPFIDMRKLSLNKNIILNIKPLWPAPSKGFMRCMGQINPHGSGFVCKGIRLNSNVEGLIRLKRKIYFPYFSDVIGMYFISFSIKKNAYSTFTIENLLSLFKNEVNFKIVNLINSKRTITLSNIENLKMQLKLQYYWATRKLVTNNKKNKLYYLKNNTICITSMQSELDRIIFDKPILLLETTNKNHKFTEDYYPLYRGMKIYNTENNNFNVYHLRRNWLLNHLDLKDISYFRYRFNSLIIFFSSLYSLLEELELQKKLDDNLIKNLIINTSTYCKYIEESGEYKYFEVFYNYMEKIKPRYFNKFIAKINSSTVLHDSQKIIMKTEMKKLNPYNYISIN